MSGMVACTDVTFIQKNVQIFEQIWNDTSLFFWARESKKLEVEKLRIKFPSITNKKVITSYMNSGI